MNLMTTWIRYAASLLFVAPLLACDGNSTEIGATAGEHSGDEASPGGDGDPTGLETNMCTGLDEEACVAMANEGAEFGCTWVDMQITDAICGPNEGSEGRCVASQYFGDGCSGDSSCIEGLSVFTRDLGDGTFEWFSSPTVCGQFRNYDECTYGDSDAEPCQCLCQGLGGLGTDTCDPLGLPCPSTVTAVQECEPFADGESWRCASQEIETNPTYGDECRAGYAPELACAGQTVCLPAEGLGVAGCDGGEEGGCCTQICDLTLGEGNPCPDEGQFCRPFYGDEQPPEGYEHVGVCRLD